MLPAKGAAAARDPRTQCPVANLFGSLFQAGRIHISDAYAPCSLAADGWGLAEEQVRKHVAVDRITGGAAESMLFDNTVLTAYPNGESPRFEVTMRIQEPTEEEARWLAGALRALDLGILRVGSSKSSGRMAIIAPPEAKGRGKESFGAIRPTCAPEMFVARAD